MKFKAFIFNRNKLKLNWLLLLYIAAFSKRVSFMPSKELWVAYSEDMVCLCAVCVSRLFKACFIAITLLFQLSYSNQISYKRGGEGVSSANFNSISWRSRSRTLGGQRLVKALGKFVIYSDSSCLSRAISHVTQTFWLYKVTWRFMV